MSVDPVCMQGSFMPKNFGSGHFWNESHKRKVHMIFSNPGQRKFKTFPSLAALNCTVLLHMPLSYNKVEVESWQALHTLILCTIFTAIGIDAYLWKKKNSSFALICRSLLVSLDHSWTYVMRGKILNMFKTLAVVLRVIVYVSYVTCSGVRGVGA